MGSGLLGIGSSALLSYQRALDTIGHNVANVNTPGYTRQQAELAARPGQGHGFGFLGAGVDVTTIQRNYNQFLTSDLRTSSTDYHDVEVMAELSGGLDNLLADESAGLNPVLGSWFDAIQGVANDPTSSAARQVLLSEANTLASRFQVLDDRLNDARQGLGVRMSAKVDDLNFYAREIASVNQQIIEAGGSANGQPPNDLLDKRDQLVLELSEIVSISTTTQANGAMNVFIGSGQSLVLGIDHSTVGQLARPGDPGQVDITIGAAGTPPVVITDLVKGGELGGMLRFRDQVLDPAVNEMGRLAIELGTFMNEQHRAGVTLSGMPGQDVFTIASPQVVPYPGNGGTVSVAFDDVSQLTAEDYRLDYDGSNWVLSNTGNGQVVPMTGTGTSVDPFIAEGLSISIGPGAVAGDSYQLRPTRTGAAGISVQLADPRDLAMASPVRTSAALANTGTGQIDAGTVTDINNPAFQSPPGQLTPPVLVRFTGPTSYELVDQGTSSVIDTGVYDPATGADVFPTAGGVDFGYRVRITGNPSAGDEFNVAYNSSGTGDNRNALLMAGMQTQQLMNSGTTSFNDAYGELVAGVGAVTRQAQVGRDVQATVLAQSEAAWSGAAGVNLDEEAADLLRYQQAYQAAAQIISVADEIFQTLIGAVRS